MKCHNHYDREGNYRCSHCGKYICNECVVEVNHMPMCKECVAELAAMQGQRTAPGPASPVGSYPPPYSGSMPKKRRDINGFFLFCLSAVPGLNYMYIGLMKRGLFFMSLFFMSIFLSASLSGVFAFAIFMVMCYSFFDGFRIRRHIMEGYPVRDDIDDFTTFVVRNKNIVILLTTAAIGLSFLNKLFRIFRHSIDRFFGYDTYWMMSELFSLLFGLVVICIGIYIIVKAFGSKGPKKTDTTDINDKYMKQ